MVIGLKGAYQYHFVSVFKFSLVRDCQKFTDDFYFVLLQRRKGWKQNKRKMLGKELSVSFEHEIVGYRTHLLQILNTEIDLNFFTFLFSFQRIVL